jgi:hypothetical protein
VKVGITLEKRLAPHPVPIGVAACTAGMLRGQLERRAWLVAAIAYRASDGVSNPVVIMVVKRS